MKRPLRTSLLVLAALGLAAAAGLAAPASPPAPAAEKVPLPYRITRSDVLSVGIVGEPELTAAQKKVEPTGTINLLYIGDVRVVGLTIKEAQEMIENTYREQRILRTPVATVIVEQYAPRRVRISGRVANPGLIEIPADTEITLVELIFKAGGLQDTARGSEVKVTRTMPDGSTKIFTLDIESVIKARSKSGAEAASFVVLPDDLIFVPERII